MQSCSHNPSSVDEMKYWLWFPECQGLLPVRTGAAAAIQSHRRSDERGTPPSQSATAQETQRTPSHACLVTRLLFNPHMRLHFCSRWHFFLTFSDTIRKVSISPSFRTSVTFTLWPWTLREEPTSFTSSWNQTFISASAKSFLLHVVCSGNRSHDTHKLVKMQTYHHFQAFFQSQAVLYLTFSVFKALFIWILNKKKLKKSGVELQKSFVFSWLCCIYARVAELAQDIL